MKSASAMIDITPPIGISICGNVRDDDLARGTHDPLLCNAVLMESEETSVLFLVLDWVGVDEAEATILRKRAGAVVGILKKNVVVSATHTHSGPKIITRSGFDYRNDEEEKYLNKAFDDIVEGVKSLPGELEEVSLWGAVSDIEGHNFCRRLRMADGKVVMNWIEVDPTDVVCATGDPDKQMSVVGMKRADNTWQTLMVNFTLHAAICVGRDWLWSADYVNYLRERIWEALPEKPVVHFSNGAEGDVNALDYENFNLEAFPEAQRYGRELADHAMEILGDAEQMSDKLNCVTGAVAMYRREITQEWSQWAKAKWEACGGEIPQLLHGIPSEYYAHAIINMEQFAGEKDIYPMTAVRVGDIAAVTLPGEIFSQIGLNIKDKSPFDKTFMLGLSQGYCGYIPDKKAFAEGGYEQRTGRGSRYEVDSCDKIESVAQNLLELL
ncbi:MAG: hypothetical protein HN948_03335 [Clostridia bacterium]|jgi:neutral ceramidase|nr:hypothetical protein [Clostridia bacterium]MBT7122025.1 hypothetical protein [Clostridia bacterium]